MKMLHFFRSEVFGVCSVLPKTKSLVEGKLKEASLVEGFSSAEQCFRNFGARLHLLSSSLHVVLDLPKLTCLALLLGVKLSPL